MNDWDNFFQLKEGDIIQDGDECLCDDEWEPATHEIGTPAPDPVKIAHRIYRRRKPKTSVEILLLQRILQEATGNAKATKPARPLFAKTYRDLYQFLKSIDKLPEFTTD